MASEIQTGPQKPPGPSIRRTLGVGALFCSGWAVTSKLLNPSEPSEPFLHCRAGTSGLPGLMRHGMQRARCGDTQLIHLTPGRAPHVPHLAAYSGQAIKVGPSDYILEAMQTKCPIVDKVLRGAEEKPPL